MYFSKDYSKSVLLIHSYQMKGLGFEKVEVDIQQVYSHLSLPLTRLGEYGMIIAPIFVDLDDQAKRTTKLTMKMLEKMHRKCQLNALTRIYEF